MSNISNNYFAFYIYLLEMDNREFLNGMEQMMRRMDAQEELTQGFGAASSILKRRCGLNVKSGGIPD